MDASQDNSDGPVAERPTRQSPVPGSSEFSGFARKILEKSC
jgi:hypothetical protein